VNGGAIFGVGILSDLTTEESPWNHSTCRLRIQKNTYGSRTTRSSHFRGDISRLERNLHHPNQRPRTMRKLLVCTRLLIWQQILCLRIHLPSVCLPYFLSLFDTSFSQPTSHVLQCFSHLAGHTLLYSRSSQTPFGPICGILKSPCQLIK
jgi:hypothetical protein